MIGVASTKVRSMPWRRLIPAFLLGVLAGSLVADGFAADAAGNRTLVDLATLELNSIRNHGTKVEGGGSGTHRHLRVSLGGPTRWPGIVIAAPHGPWNLSAYEYVAVEVRSAASHTLWAGCRLDSAGRDRRKPPVQTFLSLAPGERATIWVRLPRMMPAALAGKLFGMRGFPFGWSENLDFDPSRVDELTIAPGTFPGQPKADWALEVLNIRAAGKATAVPVGVSEHLFPLVDVYGQFIHADWPEKIHSAADFARHRAAEAEDLARHAGPADWDAFGGWREGPPQKASGFFYPAKLGDKWWLVDPAGRLFWSHGINGVLSNVGATPISDRKHWFQELPDRSSPLARFYGRSSWAPLGYYQGKPYEEYRFSAANLWRKYGPQWEPEFAARAQIRLRSWALNTAGNWSDSKVCLLRKTPYVVAINAKSILLEGSHGYWSKFADVFDPGFRKGLDERMARERGASAGDPWCIGYFVDNERGWGDELSLAVATLASPPDQAAKQVFLEDLKRKYGGIDRLNRAWGTTHTSWNALGECRQPPDAMKARDDLAAFATRVAEQYFRTCREAVKQVAPHNLYLGCRFASKNDGAIRVAARFCDVVSFNLYQDNLDDFRLPEGVDRPVVIGEFGFGALDRGMFHTGLRPVANPAERGQAYRRYVESALAQHQIVGAHWFQYADQATTGRGDGENYQVGFVDVCDTPYAETIDACRSMGERLYRFRFEK